MKKIRIYPEKLQGTVTVPSSKSMGHRELICAALAAGTSKVDNISFSKDIEATCRCLRAMGVKIAETKSAFEGRSALLIHSEGRLGGTEPGADCGESGSTLRFFVPLAALLDRPFTFTGGGKLAGRPLEAYYNIFAQQGIEYHTEVATTGLHLPLTVAGRLRPGRFSLPGNVSSQYVSGLLFALPLLEGDSVIEITSPLESSSYVDLTLASLAKYGIKVENEKGEHRRYLVPGGQHYSPRSAAVEGDWSQAAFWAVAGALGGPLSCKGLDLTSLQGDRVVADLVARLGAKIEIVSDGLRVKKGEGKSCVIDGSNCPDIIPVLTVLAAVSPGHSSIINAGRLRLKECDRLAAISSELNKLGAKIEELPEGLEIEGVPFLEGGGEAEAWNDHRIAMSLAVAAACCRRPFVLNGADSVKKSYPGFWEDYEKAGGKIEVLA